MVKDSVADSYLLGIALQNGLTLADADSEKQAERLDIGSHKAVRFLSTNPGICVVAIELSAKSRVDVEAVGGDGQKLCAPALDAAKLVEPELP
ncbi:hypothetical protein Aglo03_32130 [Actinokineospora globicatena]|uniref:Uncharacterized protein n=1 Tax=Actinokineospora globicatena TaxID=103729 RepID=A0A9W6QMP3_9PSEU|nr:hypothetical protein Aglo03_32130 [Actinokineospora globicatena]